MNIDLLNKLSENDMLSFNEEFKTNISLKSVSYCKNGASKIFSYTFTHPQINSFKKHVKDWLIQNNVRYSYLMLSSEISINTYDTISESVINDFENEFDVKFKYNEISCGDNNYKYAFS